MELIWNITEKLRALIRAAALIASRKWSSSVLRFCFQYLAISCLVRLGAAIGLNSSFLLQMNLHAGSGGGGGGDVFFISFPSATLLPSLCFISTTIIQWIFLPDLEVWAFKIMKNICWSWKTGDSYILFKPNFQTFNMTVSSSRTCFSSVGTEFRLVGNKISRAIWLVVRITNISVRFKNRLVWDQM